MFKLEIETDNAAFADGYQGLELARILRSVANILEEMNSEGGGGVQRDINGNTVGSWSLDPQERI